MKILRIRRGFTTNSSSASEFIPSANGQATPANNAEYKPGYEPILPPAPYSSLVQAEAANVTATAKAAVPVLTATTQQGPASELPSVPATGGNGLLIGGFAALVALAFVAEKLLRRLLGKLRKDADDV
jgi:hypothetical protein